MCRAAATFLLVVLAGTAARADGLRVDDDLWKVSSSGRLGVDAGVIFGLPATWQTGLPSGVGGGFSYGRAIPWGVRAPWSTATESSLAWSVSHDDFRLRATAAVQHAA